MATDDESAWMNEQARVTLEELAALSGLPEAALRELVECGVLVPVDAGEARWSFSAHYVVAVRSAGRLRRDFDLDPSGLAVAFSLLERVRALEEELRGLRAQYPRRAE